MSAEALEAGYQRAYRDFYRWGSILRGARTHDSVTRGLRHAGYAAGWKRFEPCWDVVIRAKRAGMMLPVLETILTEFGRRPHDMLGAPTKQTAGLGLHAVTGERRSPCSHAAGDVQPQCIPCSRSS